MTIWEDMFYTFVASTKDMFFNVRKSLPRPWPLVIPQEHISDI